ncbi:glycosyl hydrolase [Flavobacterium sp.]|uniref:glycoside hydrolase family 26 protein n=1 Tax=Flavobacterium sp. TaxID=239 RepID=UPI0031CE364E
MRNLNTLLSVVFLILTVSCSTNKVNKTQHEKPSKEVVLQNLKTLTKKGILFGHQDDLAYGIGWSYEPDNSDVKRVTGDYPAVYGWELGHLELGDSVNIDGVPFEKMKEYVKEVYKKGGLNTFSWHEVNPYNGKSAWDTTSTIKHLLKEPKLMSAYHKDLDKAAIFFNSLKDENGNAIPVIFRPLHEQTGNWFWWGSPQTSAQDYIKFWQLTVDYLKRKGVENVLYAYSTTEFPNKEYYLERYPGDQYVDILGFDAYQTDAPKTDEDFRNRIKKMVSTLKEIGAEHDKLIAFTEVGLEQIPNPNWWTEVLQPILENADMSYVMLWRNGRPDHYFVPYPGQVSENNFKTFYKSQKVLFQEDLTKEKVYQKK